MAESKFIDIKGAREHNLKNINISIPKNELTVITGLSGSGKSSLAFDTIYAEGQRRYVESLSAYARQFLDLMKKPDVDSIEGLAPAISIEQKTTSHNPRSTVGTITEIYDYMRLLWARAGTPYSPATGLPIEAQTVSQMVDKILALPQGIFVLADTALTDEVHTYSRLFHFNSRGRVMIEGGDRVQYQGERAAAGILFPDQETELSYVSSRMSRHYNSIEANPAVKADIRADGSKTMFAVVICGAGGEERVRKIPVENPVTGRVLEEKDAQALEIQSGGHIYTAVFRTQDLTGPWDLLRAGSCMGIGRILVSEDGKEPTVFG